MPNGIDKNWVRACLTLEGFHDQYGKWPQRLLLPEWAMKSFRDFIFSPESLQKIEAQLELVPTGDNFIAEDDQGNQCAYGDACFGLKGVPRARDWLGVSPDCHGY